MTSTTNPRFLNKINILQPPFGLTCWLRSVTVQYMKLCLAVLLLSTSMVVYAMPPTANTEGLVAHKGLIDRIGEHLQQTRESVGERASGLVLNAMGFLGVPYKFGGSTPEAGFDCSGFVRAVFEQSVGKVLPRRAEDQAAVAERIDRNDLKPGDLVFFNTMRRAFSHVGIYVGDGKFIHSPRAGSYVRVEDMRQAYWQTRFNGARRVSLPMQSPEASAIPSVDLEPILR